MSEKTVYISGKITGEPSFKLYFGEAERELREEGWRVISPTILPGNLDYEQYMTICFAMIDVSDCVYMLRNWKDSKGAQRELEYARAKSKNVLWQK